MLKKYLPILFIAVAISAYTNPHTTYAGEINYGSLKDQYGATLLLEYKGPAGAQYFTCTIAGKCKKKGAILPNIFPSVAGSKTYAKSADGTLAVRELRAGTNTYYFLYDLTSPKPKKLTAIPYSIMGATISFAKNNNAVVFKNGLQYTRYDIASKKLSNVTLVKDLAFTSFSPSATYVTGYNYGTEKHELWRFADGVKIDGPIAMQSYLEFSEDETQLAYLDDVQGFKTLHTMKTSELGKATPTSIVALTKPKTETEDYLYIGNTLYFMANVDGPLEWDLWNYDGKKTTLVDTDVSYGDFLKRVRTKDGSYLAYQKTVGKNTDITLISPNPGKKIALTAVKASPATAKVTREVKVYGGRTGVLIAPVKPARNASLFVWMHGGPQRQVAKGYHPYLSYAVYDELMERLADAGNYVYKIDYTGSTGYGADFRKKLDMKIGDVEMNDIENAIKDIDRNFSVDKVYLIGNSYGGYMALRGIVDMPKTLDGVVSINGVSDWYGLIQQIPSSPFRELFNGVPDTTNMDAYLQASVFTGMEKLTKDDKVLVVWGEQDSTVPVWQSTHYVEYAKEKDINVDTLIFSDEEHILRKRSTLDTLCKKVTSFLGVQGVVCKAK
ncbi:MAG: prolyl oligopeptidase family serine peptidase [Candidatus Pacebacteria bacterium]|nr:prolyl oligopeptidase family serine peptidase [Candidatus Paceibacterota bacterium]